MNLRIKKVEPHIDIADLYKCFKYESADFYSDKDIIVNLKKLKEANVKVLGSTLYFDEEYLQTDYFDGVKSYYDWYEKLFSYTNEIYKIQSYEDINTKSDKIGSIYTIEGFQCLRTPEDFDYFYDLGVRMFGMTWSGNNDYASGRHGDQDFGISDKGLDVLRMMNNKKLIIDIAHLGENAVVTLGESFQGMIVTTHGNARSVHNSQHNLKDSEIDLIVDRGGVVSLFPLTEDTGGSGKIEDLLKHVEYIINKWGDDYVAISSDIFPLPEYPFLGNAKDVLVINDIEDAMIKRFGPDLTEKVFFRNWMRVLEKAL